MGIAESPLRDRVIFVQGAPRSGTTWLVTLLASHPEIAGIDAESHLFTRGVDAAFDNFEGSEPWLSSYLESRAQLVDLARDFCDGVLLAMRARAADGDRTEFVVEKTPSSARPGARDLTRKRECYPDGWYVHIVRDREAVVRSLMKSPWRPDRSLRESTRVWEQAVESTRRTLSDLPRYREVRYEDLREDPAAAVAGLFEWLGVDAGPRVLDTARALSRERYSDRGTAAPPGRGVRTPVAAARSAGRFVKAAPRRARALASRVRGDKWPAAVSILHAFPRALRDRDAEALRALTTDSVALEFRSPEGDLTASGDEARAALMEIAGRLFGRAHVGESWGPAGGFSEQWSSTHGLPLWTILFSAWDGRAHRVDLAFGLFVADDRVTHVTVISAGPLEGRELTRWGGPGT